MLNLLWDKLGLFLAIWPGSDIRKFIALKFTSWKSGFEVSPRRVRAARLYYAQPDMSNFQESKTKCLTLFIIKMNSDEYSPQLFIGQLQTQF